MKKIKISDNLIIIVSGLSNGDVIISTLTQDSLSIIGEFERVHDFGVNAIDAKRLSN